MLGGTASTGVGGLERRDQDLKRAASKSRTSWGVQILRNPRLLTYTGPHRPGPILHGTAEVSWEFCGVSVSNLNNLCFKKKKRTNAKVPIKAAILSARRIPILAERCISGQVVGRNLLVGLLPGLERSRWKSREPNSSKR